MIRVLLPGHLRTLAGSGKEVQLEVPEPITQRSVLDALETAYPALRGTVRDQQTLERRPLVRFFACKQDLSHEPLDAPLPSEVANGSEPYMIVGAMAGGIVLPPAKEGQETDEVHAVGLWGRGVTQRRKAPRLLCRIGRIGPGPG